MKAKMLWKTFAAWILTVLGLSSCDEIFSGMDMYGCPYADYDVTIKVTDEEGNPIQGIRARSVGPEGMDKMTDSQGEVKEYLKEEYHLYLVLEDIDGEANGGKFLPDTLKPENYKMTKTAEGKDWYKGRFDARTEVKLKKDVE